jgi:pilus assembly protein Flp/PilA
MNKLLSHFTVWKMNREGATAIEYGLIAAGISVAIVAVVFLLGGHIKDAFTTIDGKISGGG